MISGLENQRFIVPVIGQKKGSTRRRDMAVKGRVVVVPLHFQ